MFHLMGTRVRVHFVDGRWPVPYGNYTFDGFDDDGIWVTHDTNGQRYIYNWYIDRIEPRQEGPE